MPDTGAPWNIPYVTSTDLVSDWPADSLALANAIDAGLDAAGNAGIGSNVVQTVKTDTFSTTSTSFVTVTGMTATITPSSASSKILIVAQVSHGGSLGSGSNFQYGYFKMTRGGTDIYIGDAASNRTRAVFGGYVNASNEGSLISETIIYLDSPATTSATTYQLETKRVSDGTVYVNRSFDDSDTTSRIRGASSVTLIEVAA